MTSLVSCSRSVEPYEALARRALEEQDQVMQRRKVESRKSKGEVWHVLPELIYQETSGRISA
jgi:hypothetical protein